MRKLQLISLDGDGDDYLLAYIVTASGNFQVWRWNMANGNFEAQGISTDVTDFGVDRNYPNTTNTTRVFATYIKDGDTHSGRSTSGSYGFDWVDELDFGTQTAQLDLGYGRNGAIYTVYTGNVTGNLYARTNTDYNDPVSWEVRETITTGAVEESLNPKIKAARKNLATDEVILFTSQRDVGATNGYRLHLYTRENEAAYTSFYNGFPLANESIPYVDLWIRKVNEVNVVRTAIIFEKIDALSNNRVDIRTYDDGSYNVFDVVSDADVDAWEGFSAAVAETDDNLPCMAFTGTSGGGTFGYGLYFDAETEITLNIQDSTIEGLTYYPNPTINVLHIQANTTLDRVEVYGITGAKVLDIQNNKLTNSIALNTSNLAAGIYVMKVSAGSQTGTYKVVKQ